MRVINVKDITEKIQAAVIDINLHTSVPVMKRLEEILEQEPSPAGKQAMQQIVDNRLVASHRQIPMCQDTGMAIIFVEVGQDVRLIGGDLTIAITEGVRKGYEQGYLRNSIVAEPLFDRRNTEDNTPPIIHYQIVSGDQIRLIVAAKGFGAENMSWVKMLTPAQGIDEVKQQVIHCVEEAGPNACPPIVVGLGIGGTLEIAALLAKKALMRKTGQRNPDSRYAELELELLKLVNQTGIGPQGWGGVNTAIDVRVEYFATHIACLPLAVNLDCHLQRHVEFTM